MKNILLTTCKALGWLGLCLCMAGLGYVCVRADMAELYHRGYQDGYSYVKSVEELQAQVGAKIDGKVSPDYQHSETQKKWDAAICQQFANVHINDRTMGIKQ